MAEWLRFSRPLDDSVRYCGISEASAAIARPPLALRITDYAHPVALGRLLHGRATAVHVVATIARVAKQHVILKYNIHTLTYTDYFKTACLE